MKIPLRKGSGVWTRGGWATWAAASGGSTSPPQGWAEGWRPVLGAPAPHQSTPPGPGHRAADVPSRVLCLQWHKGSFRFKASCVGARVCGIILQRLPGPHSLARGTHPALWGGEKGLEFGGLILPLCPTLPEAFPSVLLAPARPFCSPVRAERRVGSLGHSTSGRLSKWWEKQDVGLAPPRRLNQGNGPQPGVVSPQANRICAGDRVHRVPQQGEERLAPPGPILVLQQSSEQKPVLARTPVSWGEAVGRRPP